MPQPKEHYYTLDDILALPEGERAELIDGQIYYMASPSMTHQRIAGRLYNTISNHISDNHGTCEPFIAPFAVFPFDDDKTYLEPDISVICDSDKLQEDGCHGAPDWIIEIASPSTSNRDLNVKRKIYQAAGVREYWIIIPDSQTVIVCTFADSYQVNLYDFADPVPVFIWPGFSIRIADLLEAL